MIDLLRRSSPFLLNKLGGVIFVILCLLIMGGSCNRGNTSSDETNGSGEQVTAGSLAGSSSSDDASQSDTQEEEASTSEEDADAEEDAEEDADAEEVAEEGADAEEEAEEDADVEEDTEEDTNAEESEEASTDFEWQELGETTYNNCLACHQANGEGLPGAFPPLKGHITELYQVEGGRRYLINVVLYGLQGQIEVKGTSYSSAMTSHSFLSDEQIAAVLNHELNSWGNDKLLEEFDPILPSEVEAERENAISAQEVLELRPDLP